MGVFFCVSMEEYAMHAIDCGLFADVRSWARSSSKQWYVAIQQVCVHLLRFPRAVEKMQAEGLMTALVLELMESPCPEGPKLVAELMVDVGMAPGSSDASGYFELVVRKIKDAGASDKFCRI